MCFFGSCRLPWNRDSGSLSVLTYNVQNLFDGVSDGTEYSEFDPGNGRWSSEASYMKMQALSRVIRSSVRGGPDILCLQEVEKQKLLEVLQDDFLADLGYDIAFLARREGAAIGLGVLSRIPVSDILIHDSGSGRYILEAGFCWHDVAFVLFCNHWKSKLGGAGETMAGREASACLLAERMREIAVKRPDMPVLIAGDLNEEIGTAPLYSADAESSSSGAEPDDLQLLVFLNKDTFTALPEESDEGTEGAADRDAPIPLYSPWAGLELPGSYMYRGEWEAIDHILCSRALFDGKGLEYRAAEIVDLLDMRLESGKPKAFRSTGMDGYSDHLPVLAFFDWLE